MKLAEAWRLSRIPYQEVVYRSLAEERGRMWWGAFGRSQPSKEAENDLDLTNRALRIAKFDKTILSVFNVIVAVAPFEASILGAAIFGLASSVALSLAVTFGFTALYAIQTLSSFVSAESSILLSVLPIGRDDSSLITLFSFVRSVDYMVVGSVSSQVAFVAFLTRSPSATLIMLVAATLNQIFAVSIALWFSKTFQRNLLQGGRSKVHTVLRLVFILGWGLLLVGVGSLFSIPWYIAPNLENTLLWAGNISNLLSLMYPFSTGILIVSTTFPNVALMPALLASVALAGYGLLAIFAGRWSLRTVKSIAQGSGTKIMRLEAKDFSVKIHRPLFSFVVKDLKVASRNPATAFFFVLPVLETLIVALLISNLSVLRTAMMLDATTMGAIFALFIPLALLTAEGRGLEYTKTLPISSRKIIISKTLVSTATFAFVPLALIGLSSIKNPTSFSSIFIPFLAMMSVASASIFEIKLFLKATEKGKMGAIVNDIEKIFVGVLIVLIPEVAYAFVFILSFNHGLSLLAMGTISILELAVAAFVSRRP